MGQEKKVYTLAIQYDDNDNVIYLAKVVNCNHNTYLSLKNKLVAHNQELLKEKNELLEKVNELAKSVDQLQKAIKELKGEE